MPRARIVLSDSTEKSFTPYDRFRHRERNRDRTLASLLSEFARVMSYRHIVNGVSAETCTGISTRPARPGGSWTATWSGPGTVGATQRTGSLDASGKAVDRQPINQVGTYNLNVSVVANGLTRAASGSVVVTAAAGTCLP